jgi:hypothetical protein
MLKPRRRRQQFTALRQNRGSNTTAVCWTIVVGGGDRIAPTQHVRFGRGNDKSSFNGLGEPISISFGAVRCEVIGKRMVRDRNA